MRDVTIPAADVPAAMKVAPATSEDRFSAEKYQFCSKVMNRNV